MSCDQTIENDATSNPQNPALITPTDNRFPISVSSRFSYVKKIGKGGSGLIYLSFDSQLQRHVALKFFLNSSQKNIPNLISEAQSQARVEHNNICQIYEIIESEDSVFLVLQYIDGKNLHDKLPSITFNQIIDIFLQCAFALHTAHQNGIMHRDFKPMNIMISDAQDELVPHLIDFGLAWDLLHDQESGKNRNAGTLNFMPPEQSNNSENSIDHRADIYSLGASLYYCVSGGIHYQKDNFELLTNNAQKIPKDVQLILKKCLASSPLQRYQTAQEVGDELQRYLNNEPINARTGITYRLSRKIKKHKWMFSSFIASLLIILSILTVNRYNNTVLQENVNIQIEFNEEINAVESAAQFTYMSPLHNIEFERNQWNIKILEIKETLKNGPPTIKGVANYAIGRIYIELKDYEQAIPHLEKAYQLGPNNNIAFYLAIAYSEKFNQEFNIINNIPDKKSRQSKLLILNKTYKEPAKKLLLNNLEKIPHVPYAKALLAYYQNDLSAASSILDNASSLPFWFYLDDILQGDVLLKKARQLHESGSAAATIIPIINKAITAYNVSIEIAPSDPSARLRPMIAELLKLRVKIQAGITVDRDVMTRISSYSNNIEKIDASYVERHQIAGQLAQFYALSLHYSSGSPQPWFELAEQELTIAATQKKNSQSWLALGSLYTSMLEYYNAVGLNTDEIIDKAIQAFLNISPSNQDYYYFNELATLHRSQTKNKNNKEANELYKNAINYYFKANKKTPENIGSLINAASTMFEMSENYTANSRYDFLNRAIKIINTVLEKFPNHFVANYYLTVFQTELFELKLYRNIHIELTPIMLSKQLKNLKSINSSPSYVLDLALRIQQYNLDNQFKNTKQWHKNIDNLIKERRELFEKFPNNNFIIKHYIRSLCDYIAIRLALSLPAEPYINQFSSVLKNTSNMKSIDVYHPLLIIFKHWDNLETVTNPLVTEYNTNQSSSYAEQWIHSLIKILMNKDEDTFETFQQEIYSNHGLLPFYKNILISSIKNDLIQPDNTKMRSNDGIVHN